MPTGEPAGSSPNVGVFQNAIKGKEAGQGCGSSHRVLCAQLFFEQLVRRAAMTRGIGHMLLDTSDFGFEQLDPLLELVNRKWPQVLLRKQGKRILRPAGEEVIVVHGGGNVDPRRRQVNKLAPVGSNGGVDE